MPEIHGFERGCRPSPAARYFRYTSYVNNSTIRQTLENTNLGWFSDILKVPLVSGAPRAESGCVPRGVCSFRTPLPPSSPTKYFHPHTYTHTHLAPYVLWIVRLLSPWSSGTALIQFLSHCFCSLALYLIFRCLWYVLSDALTSSYSLYIHLTPLIMYRYKCRTYFILFTTLCASSGRLECEWSSPHQLFIPFLSGLMECIFGT